MKKITAILICSIFTSIASAETFTLAPSSSNAQVMSSGSPYQAATVRVGETTLSPYGCASVFVFGLPKIPFGESITGANFSVNVAALEGGTFYGDLYSLGISSSNAVFTSDYYQGSYGSHPNAAAIQQGFLIPSTPLGFDSASSSGNTNIATDLQRYLSAGVSQGSYYFLRVSPSFTTATSTTAGWNVSLQQDVPANQPKLTITASSPPGKGRVLFEYWTGISGADVSNLTSDPNYPNKPTGREYSTVMEIPQNMDTNSGTRMRGYFYVPTTGNYSFAIAGDDTAELLFSTDTNPVHAIQIASVPGNTGYHAWSTYPSQISSSIALTAGQVCYMEALHKQGTGESNLSIGYMPPGQTSILFMPTTNMAPYDTGAAYSSGAIANSLQPLAHPRLMTSPAAIARLVNEVTTGSAQYNSAQAASWTTIKNVVTSTTKASTPNGNYLQGPLLGSAVVANGIGTTQGSLIYAARILQDKIYYLAFFYQMESKLSPGDPNIQAALNQIYAELQSASNWGGSNADVSPWMSGKWDKYQFLDLPEVSHAYAISYDWCYLGWTSAQRSFIVDCISRLALGESDGGDAQNGGKNQLTTNPFTQTGNWPIVCNGGVIMSAIAVLGDETTYLPGSQNPSDTAQAPTIVDTLMPTLPTINPMTEWAPDGGWPEGPAYWAFAMRYLTTLYASLETSSATCFNMDQLGGMSSMGSFLFYNVGPTGLGFNFSDAAATSNYNGPGTQYLALKYNQHTYSYAERSMGHYPTDMLWYDTGAIAPNAPLPTSTYYSNSGAISLRTAWNNVNALYVGLKGGYNANVLPYGSAHEDLEIGSFVFDALGVRWVADLGSDNYGAPGYFITDPWKSANRWQFYRNRAEGNNTLVINPGLDGGQTAKGTATITNFVSNSATQQAILDMTSTYATTDGNPSNQVASSTPVTSAKRGIRLVNGTMQIQDEVTASSSIDLNWFMHTGTTVGTPSGNTIILSSGTNLLQLTIQSPAGATWSTPVSPSVPLSTSPNPTQYANTGITTLRVEIPSTTATTLTIGMAPYVSGQAAPTLPAVTPLSTW